MIIWIITAIFILSAIFIALTKPKLLYFVLVFFAGWHSLYIDIGLQVTLYRLIIIIFLFCLPIYFSLRKTSFKFPKSAKFLAVFICYAIGITLITKFFAPESYITAFFRGESRWISQIAKLLIYMTPVFLPLLFFKKIADIKTAAKVFLGSTVVLCILGWIQSLVFYLYRINLFPIFSGGLTSAGPIRTIAVNMFGVTFHRMHSLGGEPRNFATTVAIAILLLIVLKITTIKKFRFLDKNNLLIGFFLISLFASLSTTGFVILAIGLGLIVLLSFFIRNLKIRLAFRPIIAIGIMTLIFFIVIISSGILSLNTVKNLVLARTIERQPIEIFDVAALGFLSEHPLYGLFGIGMGNIHLYARDYLPIFCHPYAYNTIFTPLSGYLIIISELGIIGLVLFLFAYLKPIFSNFQYRRLIQDDKLKKTILSLNIFAIFVLITYLLRREAVNYAYIVIGLLFFMNYKINSIVKNQENNKNKL